MTAFFNHENLHVYQKAVDFCARATQVSTPWPRRHAIRDHLPRAAESVVESIARGSAAFSATKLTSADVALGSVLECAGCLDIAECKGLLRQEVVSARKHELSTMYAMLFILRRAWAGSSSAEDTTGTSPKGPSLGEESATYGDPATLFNHERLDVYQVTLGLAEAMWQSRTVNELPGRHWRKMDRLLTTVILNLAEGNGRLPGADRRRFLDIAHQGAIKLAADLDIWAAAGWIDAAHGLSEWKGRLARVAAMTTAMIRKI